MASAVAMMIGGAVVNALAFTGGIFFYSQNWEKLKMLKKKEKDMTEQSNSWKQPKQPGVKRECKYWILLMSKCKKKHHAEQIFDDVDQAMKQYYYITGKQLDPLPPEPKLSDYYAPSSDQQNRELLFIVAGMAATGFLAYKLL